MNIRVYPGKKIRQHFHVPGDKSISHRSLMFAALAEGETRISGIQRGEDVLSTKTVLERCGQVFEDNGEQIFCRGILHDVEKRKKYFRKMGPALFPCGNSGTTARLLMGLFASLKYVEGTFQGDTSLSQRPMKRVALPLQEMGAHLELTTDNFLPAKLQGRDLEAIDYELPHASAQLKSALMFAALNAGGTSRLRGKIQGRDHTEKMLQQFGGEIIFRPGEIIIPGHQRLGGTEVYVPGDPSSAAFWIAAGLLVEESELVVNNISLNPTRVGFLKVMERMGGKFLYHYANVSASVSGNSVGGGHKNDEGESFGDVSVMFNGQLQGTIIEEHEVPDLVDEIPIFAIVASQAKGQSIVRGAKELRIKETDRIKAMVTNLQKLGVAIEELADGFIIEGSTKLSGGRIESFHDHRIAMAFAIAALSADAPIEILNADCVKISYPQFFDQLQKVTKIETF